MMIQGLLQPVCGTLSSSTNSANNSPKEEDKRTLPSPLKPSQHHQDTASTSNPSKYPSLQRPEPPLSTSTGTVSAGNVTSSENGSSTPPSGEQLKKPKSVRHLEGYKGYSRPAVRPSSKERRYKCKFQDCPCLGFHRSTDLERHLQTVHSTQKLFPCVMKKCNRKGDNGFSRKDHLSQHLRDVHNLDIPKVWRRSRSVKASTSEDNESKITGAEA